MVDLTDFLFKIITNYFVLAASLKPMNIDAAEKAIAQTKDIYYGRISIQHIIKDKTNSFNYYYNKACENIDTSVDLHVTLIISPNTTFAIFAFNHGKMDGKKIMKIMADFFNIYKSLDTNHIVNYKPEKIRCGKVLMPMKCSFIDSLAEKLGYSKNVIMQSIWSMYFNQKFQINKFSFVVSIRNGDSQTGNSVYINLYHASTFIETCKTIKHGILDAKQIKRTALTLPLSGIKAYGSIMFDSWYSLGQEYCDGIFHKGFNMDWFPIVNAVIIVMQNGKYCLIPFYSKLPMYQTDMSDFKSFYIDIYNKHIGEVIAQDSSLSHTEAIE